MAPLPKRRLTKRRKHNRLKNLKFAVATLVECPQCHTPKRAHAVCHSCGTYNGRQVLEMEAAAET